MYHRLFAPLTINKMTLKNRLVMPALHHLYTQDGAPTERFTQYYCRRAAGGVGLLIVGACRFDDYGAKESCMSLHSDHLVPLWQSFTKAIHAKNCKVAVQLYHAGRYMKASEVPNGDHALAPSAVPSSFSGETAPEMTLDEINTVITRWAQGAVRAKAAGFDGVEILGSAGYLIAQFLSPVTNCRTDQYGGSWENRCRFPLEVIAAVRTAVGEDFPILFRLGGCDFVPNSNTNQDAAAFAILAQQAGVDCFNITGGWHETRVPQLTGDVPPGGLAFLAAGIRKVVTVPVMMCNRMNNPQVCEETLALGVADLIGVGRPLLADPDFPNKIQAGIPHLIRPCVACNQGCLAHTFFERPIECLANPFCGKESTWHVTPAKPPRSVLVAGGGVAGCQAALTLAERGHSVTLWEQTGRLGGQLAHAACLPGRYEFATLIAYFEHALAHAGVSVHLGQMATPAAIAAAGFQTVVVAVGGAPAIPQLATQPHHVPLLTSTQVLAGEVPGRRVVVVGGSYIGCMLAQHLARQGALTAEQLYHLTAWRGETPAALSAMVDTSLRQVTLVEQRPKIGYGFEPGTAWTVMADLARLGVTKRPATTVVAVTPEGVLCQNPDGTTTHTPCDTVVVVGGVTPQSTLCQGLAALGIDAVAVGNCRQLGKAKAAIEDGARGGCQVD